MIKIERLNAPEELTEKLKEELTQEFKKDNKKDVWNKSFIRKYLLKMSNSKCCYCEELVENSNIDMQIDHFHPKSLYPDEVVEWNNLMPSCPHCNRNKGMHDTKIYPIVNPTVNNPKEIFYIKNFRYFSYDRDLKSLGRMTIDVLDINDCNKKVNIRYMLGNELSEKFNTLYETALESGLKNTRVKNRILNGCRNNLILCTKNSRFGASMATVLQENDDYHSLRNLLIKCNLWDDELENLHKETLEICLCKNFNI